MMYPFDIHSHHLSTPASRAIVNIRFPEPFSFEQGRYYSIGIHPWDVCLFKDATPDWDSFKNLAAHPQVLAIGECGLDKLVHPEWLQRQEELFATQVHIAESLHKPLLIHNVRSSDVLQRMLRAGTSTLPWILHGFRGNASLANQWIALGGYLSFGARYNEEAVCQTPLNRLFLETDDGQLTIEEIYKRIATVRQMSLDELIVQVQQNIREVFFNRQQL
ncbi:TatD family hydrolase [Bacteroides sp.]|uniref:TatD family hydrolase n=1 Tax=Bacteroides sp. TaxID=29523 RepID=UPI0025C037CA|nr:TatD family hydrolase [Bacteroides sp.]